MLDKMRSNEKVVLTEWGTVERTWDRMR
jgi:hypothetical protein